MRIVWALLAVVLSFGAVRPAAAEAVGLELLLAIDASASVTRGGLEFQLRGHAAAFRDPAVVEAAAAVGTAVALAAFSGPRTLTVLVPWTVVKDAAGAEAFAARVLAVSRDVPADSTALGGAIDAAADLFDGNGIEAPRRVIDLVSNGFNNAGPDPAAARDRAAARGITVNALAILDEFPWLEGYYRDHVIGGPGAFVMTAMDRDSFADALKRKLILEMVGTPSPRTDVAVLTSMHARPILPVPFPPPDHPVRP